MKSVGNLRIPIILLLFNVLGIISNLLTSVTEECFNMMELKGWNSNIRKEQLQRFMRQQTIYKNEGMTFPVAPYFDKYIMRNIHGHVGETILLPCVVHNLRNKVVSWIRKRDLHIITSGMITFSSDTRFETVHPELENFWGLRIRGAHISDAGRYECQINTDPKLSIAINLTIFDDHNIELNKWNWISQALIKGPREIYMKENSPLRITCEVFPLARNMDTTVDKNVQFPTKNDVRWFHNGELQENQHGNTIITNNVSHYNRITSELYKPVIALRDDGEYTCNPESGKPDFVKVVVEEEGHPEAMQGDFPISSYSIKRSTNIFIIFVNIFNLL